MPETPHDLRLQRWPQGCRSRPFLKFPALAPDKFRVRLLLLLVLVLLTLFLPLPKVMVILLLIGKTYLVLLCVVPDKYFC